MAYCSTTKPFIMKNVGKIFPLFAILFTFQQIVSAQTTKQANDWIDVTKTYYKIKVAKNGVYRVTQEQLAKAGFPSSARGVDLKLINVGVEKPIFVSDNGPFDGQDFIEFYGEAHTIGVDSFLYADWQTELFNPRYSISTDTNTYFLTIYTETSNARVITVNTDYNAVTTTPSAFCFFEESLVYKDFHYKIQQFDIIQSTYEGSEGFGGAIVPVSSTILKSTGFQPGIKPVLRFRIGKNGFNGRLEVRWNDRTLDTFDIFDKSNTVKAYTLENSYIESSNVLSIKNILNTQDRHRVAFATLTYPHSFDFGSTGQLQFSMSSSIAKRLLSIKKGAGTGFAYDISRNIRYSTGIKNGATQLLINGANAITYYFIPEINDSVAAITKFVPKSFNDNNASYLILSDPILQGSTNAVDQYKAYRSSADGGSFKTEIVDINDLYDHFAYGAAFHPIAIKNFVAYTEENWASLTHMMVLGKGLEYQYMRKTNDVINQKYKNFFVPTYGYPGSDILMVSSKNSHIPSVAIGRLAARTDKDILDYLDKVKSYENAPRAPQTVEDKLWMKNVLHLGGGKNVGEQSAIKSGLESFGKILVDTTFGANLSSYYKNSFDAVQFVVNQEINDKMNNGISILNFFGHSAAASWDFSLQKPSEFKNTDRYPFITSFGCYSGNLHAPSTGISELFVIQPQKAAIGFYASTGTAFIGSLADYGRKFYITATQTHTGKSVGECMKIVAENAGNVMDSNFALYSQLTYHGDPAIKLYIDDEPDYTFDYASIKTEPNAIQTATAEIKIKVNMANIGLHQKDSVDVVFYHQLPSGKNQDTIRLRIASLGAITPIEVKLTNPGLASLGRNVLYGVIDNNNQIAEGPIPDAESNNEIISTAGTKGFEFFISDNIASPIFPPNYGMINTTDHFILKASTPAAPLAETKYLIELDTTRYFNSPSLERTSITSIGGYLEYKPLQSARADQVYYWRISPDSLPNSTYKWSNSSFAMIPSEAEGWNQSHFFQFMDDEFKDLALSEETDRNFEFGRDAFFVNVKNKYWDPSDMPGYSRNNITFGSVRPWNYMSSGLAFVVFDPIKDYLRNAAGGLYGSSNPTSSSTAVYPFETNSVDKRKDVVNFLNTVLKDNQIVCMFSIVKDETSDLKIEEWEGDKAIYGTTLFEALELRGATRIKEMQTLGTVPYIFQFEVDKDSFIVLDETIALAKNEVINSEVVFDGLFKNNGNIKSTIIGPAKSWGDLKFNIIDKVDLNEKGWLNVIGVKENGQEKTLDSLLTQNKSLSNISTNDYPYLKIKQFNQDSFALTSAQLDYWRVSYIGLPDAAISVSNESFPKVTKIPQGEKLKIAYQIKNTSSVAMDSILVKYTIIDSNNKTIDTKKRLAKLPVNGIINDNFEWTIGLSFSGKMTVIIEINPDQDQPELYTFNNRIQYSFEIAGDDRNPNLLVYFDGIQILDGDIVSPKPEIKISLKDDNPNFPITDAESFQLSIDTGFNQLKIIPMSSPQIKFIPATSSTGEAQIIYSPSLKDGDYTLIVQGKDASGNLSGLNPKTVNFRVITEQTVTDVLNYPNPFSTSTEFVFTLTGEDVPNQVSISIMTLSGKVVKEITKEELGPLRIGVNRTPYKWNGTDEYGEKLANGVYFYRVNFRDTAGQTVKKRDEDKLSTYFKHGIGKLVIMR